MSARQLRVGLIGGNPGGSWGTVAHLPALMNLPRFKVTAVSTAHRDTAAQTAAQFGITHALDNADELVRHPEVDIVAVNVRVPAHLELVGAAIAAGKHVYCEWPLAVDSAQATQLLAAARQKGIVHMVGLQSRASPELNFVRDLVREGDLGDLMACTLLHSVPWRIKTSRSSAYLQDRSTGATFMSIPGGHSIDALRFCGGEFAELSATVATLVKSVQLEDSDEVIPRTSPDQVAVQGRLANNAVFSAHIQGGPSAGTGFRFELNGTRGDLVITTRSDTPSVQMADLEVYRTRRGSRELDRVDIPARYRWVPAGVPSGKPFNVAQMYAKLAEAIDSGRPADPDFGVAVAMHGVLDAIQKASDTGQRQIVAAPR